MSGDTSKLGEELDEKQVIRMILRGEQVNQDANQRRNKKIRMRLRGETSNEDDNKRRNK